MSASPDLARYPFRWRSRSLLPPDRLPLSLPGRDTHAAACLVRQGNLDTSFNQRPVRDCDLARRHRCDIPSGSGQRSRQRFVNR
jgi:hypothetical protein